MNKLVVLFAALAMPVAANAASQPAPAVPLLGKYAAAAVHYSVGSESSRSCAGLATADAFAKEQALLILAPAPVVIHFVDQELATGS